MNENILVYRDERILAVNKPAGMLVHRGMDKDKLTVADIVRDELVGHPVHAAHRLDRGTSGILLFALDKEAARCFQRQLESGEMLKRYLALVRGPMMEPCDLDHPVPREKGGSRVPARTAFRPLAHSGRWTLVEASPHTGRLHQIRRHLKHLSHPVVGDVRYGKGDVNRFFRENYGLNRLALHALSLEFYHPSGHLMQLTAELPLDFLKPLQQLGLWPLSSNGN